MEEALSSVAVQVPAVAILGYVFLRVAGLFIGRWAQIEEKRVTVHEKAETDRTTAIAKGFADIVSVLNAHGTAIASIQDAVAPFSVSAAKNRR